MNPSRDSICTASASTGSGAGIRPARDRGNAACLADIGGATLIEVLIGMLVLVIALFGLVLVFDLVIRNNARSKHVTVATALAQQRIEDLRRRGMTGAGFDNISSVGVTPVTGYPAFAIATNVMGNSPSPGMKDVAVTVSWGGNSHHVTLNTIFTSP